MSKVKLIALVLGIFFVAYYLRTMFLRQNSLTFGYDQARDAIVSQAILKGDVKIQGPPASTPGLYHGVFYYYLLAPAYFFGHGSPIVAAYWVALLNSLTVFIVFGLGYLMTKKIWVGILASALFAISFEATQYATWLSNPTIGVWTVPLMYLGLWLWLAPRSSKSEVGIGPFLTAIGLGLSIQSEIFLAYHIIPLLIWLYACRKNVGRRQLIAFGATFVLAVSSMIVGEIKFGFRGIEGIKLLLNGGEANLAYAKSVGDYLILYLNQVGRIFAFNSYPGNIGYGGLFVMGLSLYSIIKKDRVGMFLSTWLFSHLTVVTIGGTSTPFLMVGIGPAVSLIIAYYLIKWWSINKVISILVIALLVYGNISFILKENPKGATLFAIQKDLVLSKEIAAIDYTYQKANGAPFSINSLTSPLWINITWTYLYEWYGKSRYGYLPEWHGRDQVGQIAFLPSTSKSTTKYFLILEPMGGIPGQYLEQTIGEENVYSRLIDEKDFGELRVQERIKK